MTNAYRTSSYSGIGNCVEVADGAQVRVRDSKNRDGAVLTLNPSAWTQFLQAVKNGLYDR